MKLETIIPDTLAETERFDLRPIRASDAGLVAHYAGDERVARFTTSIPHPMPPGTAEAFIARVMSPDHPEDVWVMDGSRIGGGEVMGLVGLERLERNQSEIGYWVAPAYWNTGIASAAVAAILKANPQEARTVFASVFQDNPASARVLTNCGFRYLGDAEGYSVARKATVPTWTYSRSMDDV
ncbi:MAG: GNAT family N-acetyltransferase [Roseovarius sp.]